MPNDLNNHLVIKCNSLPSNKMIIESGIDTITMAHREDLERTQSNSLPMLTTDHTMSINTYSNNQISTKICNNGYLIGVVFVQDSLVNEQKTNEVSLGTILMNNNFSSTNARMLRENIQKFLFKMDENYIFLTKHGFPLSIEQENCIEINQLIYQKNIIRFQKKLCPERCSLIGYYSNNYGIFIGYIYASYHMNLKTIRNIINDNLKDITINNVKPTTNYHFLHSLGWFIIHPNNEISINLIEIIRKNSILIIFEKSIDNDSRYFTNQSDRPMKKFINEISNSEDQMDLFNIKNKTPKGLSRIKTSKHRHTIKYSKKQIMISYVRREAAEHAIQLKKSLIKCGFSVYLDVHEIQMGSDWQDSLNSAVQQCHFFVPLITQNYGRTQWTNREIKLADTLQKHIIPINFLDLWPPECLAIQFASTQYIQWNPDQYNADNDSIKENIPKIWNAKSIDAVTKLIEERIIKLSQKNRSSDFPSNETNDQTSHKQKNLIVISAHPKQSHISESIKSFLLKNFDVWCSNDALTINERSSSSTLLLNRFQDQDPNSSLSPIMEESSTITRPVKDYARYIAENSKQRPKSIPSHEKLGIKKKDLVRVFSHGESSHLTSITPDKMDRLKCFHQKVLKSALVIILASEQYYKSRTSVQHVYYCGQRIKTILVQYDKSPAPVWFSKLMSNDNPLNYESSSFKEDLLSRITRILDPQCKEMGNLYEVKIKYLADCMKQNIPQTESCVYVFGSTDTNNLKPRTVQICKEIGKELAKIKNINIVTNGLYGTGDIIAHTFYQERCLKPEKFVESVIHIVPSSYEKKSYGQTLFLGESVKERDSVIARMLDTSVLIGGDQNAAREIEEIIWNDHFVIPIKSTDGAAAGEYDVPQKIFSCPIGVREDQWAILLESHATPGQIAKAIVNVIYDLKKVIHDHALNKDVTNKKIFIEKPMKKRIAGRKKINGPALIFYKDCRDENKMENRITEPSSPEKFLPTFNQQQIPPPPQQQQQESPPLKENFVNNKIGLKGKFHRFFKQITGNS